MKSLLFAAVAAVSVGASAGTTTYTWDGTSTTYDDKVTVAYDENGKVTELVSSIPLGDKVVFTGETAATFAAGALVTAAKTGQLVFSNEVVTVGDVELKGLTAETTIMGDDQAFKVGKSYELPITFADISELYIRAATISYLSSGKVQYLSCSRHFEKCEPDRYSVQIQNFNGAWTRCIKLVMMPGESGVVISNAYCAETGDYGVNHVGRDFDGPRLSTDKWTGSFFATKVYIAVDRDARFRRTAFAGKLTAGGKITVSGGAGCVVTGEAIGAKDGATCDFDIAFNNGAFVFQDCGTFTHAGTVTGEDGELVYESSDREAVVTSTSAFEGTLTATDQVVAHNASLASLSNVTAVVRWQKYNDQPVEQKMKDEYRGDLRAMMIRNFGHDTVARFQAVADGTSMSYSTGVRFLQQGADIVAKVVSCYNVWHVDQSPSSLDPWTWDAPNDPGTGPSLRSYDVSKYTTVSNLKFTFAHPSEDVNWNTDVTILTADSTSKVKYTFRPGANRRMLAVVKSATGMPQVGGSVHVYDRATLSLAYPNVSSDYGPTYEGLWPGVTKEASSLYAHPGGRIVTNALRQNSGKGQTAHIDGGEYYFRNTGDTSYTMQRGSFFNDCVGNVHYANGAVTDGNTPYLGAMGGTATITVDGTTPSVSKNSYALYGSKESSSSAKRVLDIADVTGDDEVDFTMEGHLYSANYDYVRLFKKGAGTVLFKKSLGLMWDKLAIQEGTVLLGITTSNRYYRTNCLLGTKGVSLEGGALAIQAGVTNDITGPIALTTNSTIKLSVGSKILVKDSSAEAWADGARLTITGDPATSAISFGDADGLTAAQLKKIRWNGKRVELDEDGCLKQYIPGAAIIVR